MKHGELTRLATALGVSVNQVSSILRRNRRPSPELAVRLERETGVDRCAWIWPDEYQNPLIIRESDNAN